MKNIGIVCEGPTDFVLLKGIVDVITGEDNQYLALQPEDKLAGEYGNGWKGVWKWCTDHSEILESFMKDISPRLDMIIVQMDGDVSRKEKEVHCLCDKTACEWKDKINPLMCEYVKRDDCPVKLPCETHEENIQGHIDHLTQLISSWLKHEDGICIVIPCDSTDTWVAAAYDKLPDVEMIEDPWMSIISKGKAYHGVRIPGHKKGLRIYRQFVKQVCDNWENVKRLCISARQFENQVRLCKQRDI